ncbi:MAG: hypothetical protein B7Y99_08600 [Caulobacterales bacterium 32-69-10]|nr:MAG: hypothetical protein B7Y99_08600 [Caulobacterales bacterium 32-69-10]
MKHEQQLSPGSKALNLLTVPALEDGQGLGSSRAGDMLRGAKAVLLDWDGCISINDRPMDSALSFMNQHRGRIAVVSNNSTLFPEELSLILARAGQEVAPRNVLLAGTEAIARAVEIGASRVMVLGENRMKAYGRNQGLNIVREDADLVVLLRDTRFTYAKLERAANALRAGARLIVANPDLTHPGGKDRVVPETGALLAALTACLGSRQIEMEVIGKPSRRLFEKACQELRVNPSEAVMIGDNPATDIAGADAIGLNSILIGGPHGLSFDRLLDARA